MRRRTRKEPALKPPTVLPDVLDELDRLMDPYRVEWLALSPAERLRRSWRLRRRLRDPEAVHRAKTVPEL
jgi:hypothetical protein